MINSVVAFPNATIVTDPYSELEDKSIPVQTRSYDQLSFRLFWDEYKDEKLIFYRDFFGSILTFYPSTQGTVDGGMCEIVSFGFYFRYSILK